MITNVPIITRWSGEIKEWLRYGVGEWGLIALVFMVGLTSFGLGRLSVLEEARPLVQLAEAPKLAAPQGMAIGGLYVASRSGSTYYYPWCTGVAKILPQNRRWFVSEAAARAAGLTPAKGCKGLGGE